MRSAPRVRTCFAWALVVALWIPVKAAVASVLDGDAAWMHRADRIDGRLAPVEQVDAAIEAYRASCAVDAGRIEACWKLLRALHYLVEFTDATEARKDAAAEEASSLAKRWLDATGTDADRSRDRALLSFWSAIAWGARGQRVGLLTIVREGIASRMHEAAERAVAIDPTIERGGAYRLLSRLHASLPRVPFLTGWVERDQALPMAERAYSIDPDDPGNQLILALALIEQGPRSRRDEAWAWVERVAGLAPRPELLAEDLAIREQARERLADRDGVSGSVSPSAPDLDVAAPRAT